MQYKSNTIIPDTHRFSHSAMATIFEIIIHDADQIYAQQAATEAFREVDRLEQNLSRFIDNSDIARINNLPANKPLRIGLDAFECLKQCADLYETTSGSFDITIGSLLNCWLNKDKSLRQPTYDEIEIARQRTGMHLIKLNDTELTVELLISPIIVDLGGFGKGYAVNRIAELLREWSIETFLIHGGQSSVFAGNAPPETNGWLISITSPFDPSKTIDIIDFKNQAVSGSGIQKGHHIIDPKTAKPIQRNRATWAFAPTAAISDALSTAFMIMTPDEIHQFCITYPEIKAVIVQEEGNQVLRFGNWESADD